MAKEVKNLFTMIFGDTYTFDPAYLIVSEGSSSSFYHGHEVTAPSVKAVYEKNGIYIKYHKRMTTHLGDTDVMTDRIVKLDGVFIFNDLYG